MIITNITSIPTVRRSGKEHTAARRAASRRAVGRAPTAVVAAEGTCEHGSIREAGRKMMIMGTNGLAAARAVAARGILARATILGTSHAYRATAASASTPRRPTAQVTGPAEEGWRRDHAAGPMVTSAGKT